MCCNPLQSERSYKSEDRSVYALFTFEKARLASNRVQRLDPSALSEVNITSIVRLNTVITDVVDCLRQAIERLLNEERKIFNDVSRIDTIGSSAGRKAT